MSSLSSSTKKAMNHLLRAYTAGVIEYPRVDNNFIAIKRFDMFPHPPLRKITPMYEPLKKEALTLNKSSSLLFLSICRLIQPSNIVSYAEMIDYFFDQDLGFLSKERESEYRKIISIFHTYLKDNHIRTITLTEMAEEIYEKASDASRSGFLLFSTDDFFFLKSATHSGLEPVPSMLKTFTRWTAEQRSKKIKKEEAFPPSLETEVDSFSEISEGLNEFKKRFAQKVKIRKAQQKIADMGNSAIANLKNLSTIIVNQPDTNGQSGE